MAVVCMVLRPFRKNNARYNKLCMKFRFSSIYLYMRQVYQNILVSVCTWKCIQMRISKHSSLAVLQIALLPNCWVKTSPSSPKEWNFVKSLRKNVKYGFSCTQPLQNEWKPLLDYSHSFKVLNGGQLIFGLSFIQFFERVKFHSSRVALE